MLQLAEELQPRFFVGFGLGCELILECFSYQLTEWKPRAAAADLARRQTASGISTVVFTIGYRPTDRSTCQIELRDWFGRFI